MTVIPGAIIDGEWEHIIPPWYTQGFAYAGMTPETFLPAPPVSSNPAAPFPPDQVLVKVTQYYADADRNPLSGFLTFWPSTGFTITENAVSWRVPQRLCGTETWPGLDAGTAPWSWSTASTGKIFIWLGLMTALLYATDNPDISTDDGGALTYRVAEHFQGGRQYDIAVPQGLTGDLTSCIIPETVRPFRYDPLYPMGVPPPGGEKRRHRQWRKWVPVTDTVYLTFDPRALGITGLSVNPTADAVYVAFLPAGASPLPADWQPAAWVSPNQPYQIEFLIGPANGAYALPAGQYRVWLMIVDNPTIPVRPVGWLYITEPPAVPPMLPDTGDD